MPADDKFIEEYRSFVSGIAHKVRRQFDLTVEVDDLIGFGFAGLLEARERFDPERGVRFNTFAYYRVRGAVIDGVRQMAFLPRRVHERLRQAEGAEQITEATAETQAAVPAASRDTSDTLQAIDDSLGRLTASFVLAAVGQNEAGTEPDADPEESLLQAESHSLLRSLLPTLPEREQALLRGHYFEGRRFDEVAAELGISKSWASRLHLKALDRLRQALEEAA